MGKTLDGIRKCGTFHANQSNFCFKNFVFHGITLLNVCYRKHDDVNIGNNNFKRASTGASLRASTRGEIGSNMLQRSVRSRKSLKTIGEPSAMA